MAGERGGDLRGATIETAGFESSKLRYRGPDHGSVLTGFQEGSYFFRVRSEEGLWSEVVEVNVKFIGRGYVILLMSLGGFVFVATVGTLLFGHFTQKDRREI